LLKIDVGFGGDFSGDGDEAGHPPHHAISSHLCSAASSGRLLAIPYLSSATPWR
jgi:hypothetical protein